MRRHTRLFIALLLSLQLLTCVLHAHAAAAGTKRAKKAKGGVKNADELEQGKTSIAEMLHRRTGASVGLHGKEKLPPPPPELKTGSMGAKFKRGKSMEVEWEDDKGRPIPPPEEYKLYSDDDDAQDDDDKYSRGYDDGDLSDWQDDEEFEVNPPFDFVFSNEAWKDQHFSVGDPGIDGLSILGELVSRMNGTATDSLLSLEALSTTPVVSLLGSTAHTEYTEKEISMISVYLSSGTGLIVTADRMNKWGAASMQNALLKMVGVEIRHDTAMAAAADKAQPGAPATVARWPTCHSPLFGVKQLRVYDAASIQVTKAPSNSPFVVHNVTELLRLDNPANASAAVVGVLLELSPVTNSSLRSKLAVLGSSRILSNFVPNLGITDNNNALFAAHLLRALVMDPTSRVRALSDDQLASIAATLRDPRSPTAREEVGRDTDTSKGTNPNKGASVASAGTGTWPETFLPRSVVLAPFAGGMSSHYFFNLLESMRGHFDVSNHTDMSLINFANVDYVLVMGPTRPFNATERAALGQARHLVLATNQFSSNRYQRVLKRNPFVAAPAAGQQEQAAPEQQDLVPDHPLNELAAAAGLRFMPGAVLATTNTSGTNRLTVGGLLNAKDSADDQKKAAKKPRATQELKLVRPAFVAPAKQTSRGNFTFAADHHATVLLRTVDSTVVVRDLYPLVPLKVLQAGGRVKETPSILGSVPVMVATPRVLALSAMYTLTDLFPHSDTQDVVMGQLGKWMGARIMAFHQGEYDDEDEEELGPLPGMPSLNDNDDHDFGEYDDDLPDTPYTRKGKGIAKGKDKAVADKAAKGKQTTKPKANGGKKARSTDVKEEFSDWEPEEAEMLEMAGRVPETWVTKYQRLASKYHLMQESDVVFRTVFEKEMDAAKITIKNSKSKDNAKKLDQVFKKAWKAAASHTKDSLTNYDSSKEAGMDEEMKAPPKTNSMREDDEFERQLRQLQEEAQKLLNG